MRPAEPVAHSEPFIERQRRLIEGQYRDRPTGCGGSSREILCYEIHQNGMTFKWLARKWGLPLPTLGDRPEVQDNESPGPEPERLDLDPDDWKEALRPKGAKEGAPPGGLAR